MSVMLSIMDHVRDPRRCPVCRSAQTAIYSRVVHPHLPAEMAECLPELHCFSCKSDTALPDPPEWVEALRRKK